MAYNQQDQQFQQDWTRIQDPKQSPGVYPGVPPYPTVASAMGQGFTPSPMMAPMPGYAPMGMMPMSYMPADQFAMSQYVLFKFLAPSKISSKRKTWPSALAHPKI